MPAAAATLDTQHFSSEAVFTVLSQPLPQQRHFERGRALAPTARDSWARGGLPPRALQRVRDYIAAHLDGNITNDALAGRVLVLWTGKPAGLIPVGDPGYTALEGWPPEGSKLVAP